MAVYTITGSKFEVGAVVALKSADFVAADFTTPLTAATEVKEPKTLGAPIDEWATAEFGNVTDGRTRVFKVMRKGKAFDLVCGIDPTDAGQIAMRAAFDAAVSNYAMRFTFADKPTSGASPKNSTRLFVGAVIGVEDDPSGEIGLVKFSIQPNSNIVVTHASPT
jgi:hypothetical protein